MVFYFSDVEERVRVEKPKWPRRASPPSNGPAFISRELSDVVWITGVR
jgi:hypothetical protein